MNAFEIETWNSLKSLKNKSIAPMYCARFSDTNTFRRFNENITLPEQPADFYAIYKSRIYFIECKSTKSKTSFQFRYVKPHQKEKLFDAYNAGAKSYLLINNRSTPRNYKTYAISISEYLKMEQKLRLYGKCSIKWDELGKYSIELPREKALWGISILFEDE